jgi:hypothetical protein
VLIPRAYGRDTGDDGAPDGGEAGDGMAGEGAMDDAAAAGGDSETLEAVLFRHGDGNVLAQTLPQLGAAQFSRLFGPAIGLTFPAPDYPSSNGSPVRRAPLPADAPPAPAGLLRLTAEQLAGIEEARLEKSRRRIAAYLREVAPERTASMSDAELAQMTAAHMDEARGYGVRSEAGMGRWSYMALMTGGKLSRNADVRSVMTANEPSMPPDDRVRLLLQASLAHARGEL